MDASTIAALMAYVDHLDTHPHLADSLSSMSLTDRVPEDSANLAVLVFDHKRGHRTALASWVRTLSNANEVKVRNDEGHVRVTGQLADGTEITVRSILGEVERELFRANNVKIEAGETFPVGLLLRVVNHAHAESPAGTFADYISAPRVEPLRVFRNQHGVTFRTASDGHVEVKVGAEWRRAAASLDDLLEDPYVREITMAGVAW